MARKKQISPEELREQNLQHAIQEEYKAIELGVTPLNPTRSFEVGERIIFGAHEEVYIREVHADGLFYVCEALNVKRKRDEPPANEYHARPWYDIYKYDGALDTNFTKEEKYRIRQLNSGVMSLLHMVYGTHTGVDFDVEYQREHVWELEDKVALIDSIFNNVDIGKFVFVQRHTSTKGKYYEVIDGKQRLTALCEFYEDRFPYKGFYFSQLSHKDKNKFEDHPITYGYLENPDLRGIYETFIKLNTCGKPMDHKHIDKVKGLLKDLDNGQ